MPSCKTYLTVDLPSDQEKNIEIKEAVEGELHKLTGNVAWRYRHFELGYNEKYDVDVNEMLRVTLRDFIGKESELRRIQTKYGVSMRLVIVPYLVANGEEPSQYLSLERDIIEFLYFSGVEIDLDYYII